jgi:hypothetical protein
LNDLNSVQLYFTAHKCDSGTNNAASSFRVRITSSTGTISIEGFTAVRAHSVTVTLSLDPETGMIGAFVSGGSSPAFVEVGEMYDQVTVSYEASLGAAGQQFCSRLLIGDILGFSM